jgi:hypothetical protein
MTTEPGSDSPIAQAALDLKQAAETGESAETPLLLYGGVWVVSAIVAVVITSLALIAYRLAA